LGIVTSPAAGLANTAPQETLQPLFVSSVQGGPAADNGLQPGDVIESVNGAPPFADGIRSAGVMNLLNQQYPRSNPAWLRLYRPATGHTWTVTLKPTWFTPTPQATQPVTFKLLNGDPADVRLAAFVPNAADLVRQAIDALRDNAPLRGLVLDLRGNRSSPTPRPPSRQTHRRGLQPCRRRSRSTHPNRPQTSLARRPNKPSTCGKSAAAGERGAVQCSSTRSSAVAAQ
jgi:hypothetical protein